MEPYEIIDFLTEIISPEFHGFNQYQKEKISKITLNDWNTFIEISNRNFISPIVYQSLQTNNSFQDLPLKTQKSLADAVRKHLMRNLKIKSVFIQLIRIFNDNKLEFIALKGIDIQNRIYTQPALRPMLDIDVLMKEPYGFKATKLLLSMGARKFEVSESEYLDSLKHHEAPLIFNDVAIEVHRSLVDIYDNTNLKKIDVWSYLEDITIDGFNVKVLQPELLIIYMCHHLHSTLQGGKIKLFWYYDIYRFFEIYAGKSLNKSLLYELLDKSDELFVFKKICLQAKLIFPSVKLPDFLDFEVDFNHKKEIYDAVLCMGENKAKPHYVEKFLKVPGFYTKIKFLYYKLIPSKAFMLKKYNLKKERVPANTYIKHFFITLISSFKSFSKYLVKIKKIT